MARFLGVLLGLTAGLGAGFAAEAPALAPASAAAAAAALIDKHVSWLGGWEALDAVRDIRTAGTIAMTGLEGSLTLEQRRDGFGRAEYDLGVLRGVECVAGEDSWRINASGQLEELGAVAATRERRVLARTFGAHLRGEGASIQHAGREERGGRGWEVLRFVYPDGDSYDLLLDASDGSSEWAREVRDTTSVWLRRSDWQKSAGVLFPRREEIQHTDPRQNQTLSFTRVEVNTGIDSSRFTRPPDSPRVARIAEGAASTSWLSIASPHEECICLRGRVNGAEFNVLLDSGAGITVLERAVVERLGLRAEGSLTAQGTSGSAEAAFVGGVRVELGALQVGDLTAATIDLSAINKEMEIPLEVILGKEVFNNVVVEVDYPGRRVRFHDPGRFAYEGPGRALPLFHAAGGHKQIEMQFEDLPPALVEIDTGSEATLDLFRHYTDQNKLLEGRAPVSEELSAGVGGTAVSKVATLRSVTLGGYTLRNVPTGFHRKEEGAFNTKTIAGNLGTEILRRFRVIFDYTRGRLWLEPGEGWDRPFEKDRSGLQVSRDGQTLKVMFVAPGSPAAAGRWREGDRIAAVNGHEIDSGYSQALGGWNEAPAGTRVRLRLVDGEERMLTLSDYF